MECFTILADEIDQRRLDPYYHSKIFKDNEKIIRNSKFEVKLLKDVSKKIVDGPFGSQLKVEEYVEKGIPLIRVKDVKDQELLEDNFVYISKEKQEQLKRSKVLPGDVLLTKAGSIGNACVFPKHLREANITSHLAKIEVNNVVYPEYLCKYLNTKYGRLQIFREGNKTTRPELNISEVSSILVIVPPLGKQEKIVQLMDKSYFQKREKKLEAQNLLDSLNDYVLGELGIVPLKLKDKMIYVVNYDTVKNNRLDAYYYQPKFEEVENIIKNCGVEVKKLKECFDGELVKGILPTDKEKEGGAKVLQIKNILRNGLINTSKYVTAKNIFGSEHKIKKGEVILVITGATIGKVGLWYSNEDFYLGGDMVKFFTSDNVDPYYIQAFLLSQLGQYQLLRHITGATNKHLSPDDIEKIKIPIPSFSVQNKIGEEFKKRMQKAEQLKNEAKEDFEKTKQEVEKMILG
ncbi:MAG: restriction endonuclease subunit S [Candidatus Aenigmarchaeota archaeon]|nr:restriction endonuclease subunit S [Candidatus Aenigmarchaeota archaeon]